MKYFKYILFLFFASAIAGMGIYLSTSGEQVQEILLPDTTKEDAARALNKPTQPEQRKPTEQKESNDVIEPDSETREIIDGGPDSEPEEEIGSDEKSVE